MKIANGIEMLEISSKVLGKPNVINPTLIWDEHTVILVDSGYPGQLPQIREAIAKTGVSFDKLNMVILTHQDIDHIGNVSSIITEMPDRVEVLAHKDEKPYIDGEKTPTKLAQMEANLISLPDEMKAIYEKMKSAHKNCKVNVDETLTDNEELPCCGGITVIHTPGHTLGHICLYLKQSKVLIAGDMLTIENGVLMRMAPSTNFDTDQSILSLKKLTKYNIESVICYHGGMFKNNVNQRILELANE